MTTDVICTHDAEAAYVPGISADSVVASILDLAATRMFALEAMLSVSHVEWSSAITTACVECAHRPRLLLNPKFIAENCATHERLATLVLHELAHISMGHTRLYPRGGWAYNIAFDAVINRDLSFHFAGNGDAQPYTDLFTSLYRPGSDPEFLLRPPDGWPGRPQWGASEGCSEELRGIHRRLYDPAAIKSGRRRTLHVTYAEIISALQRGVTSDLSVEQLLSRLLGSHGATDMERAAESGGRDERATIIVKDLFEEIGAIRVDGEQAGPGGEPEMHPLDAVAKERLLELALEGLFRRTFAAAPSLARRMREVRRPTVSVNRHRDRRAVVREAISISLGLPRPLLFSDETIRRIPEPGVAPVYIDVSGSMRGIVERLHAALVPLRRRLKPEIFAFSTIVEPVAAVDFERRLFRTTGGTSIQPVIDHALKHATNDSRADVVILTDGYFNSPDAWSIAALRASGLRIHLAVLGNGPLHEMEAWVKSSTRLPDNAPEKNR